MAPVTRVTVHHEGAGDPTDNVSRFREGGYTLGIGVSRYEIFRTPWVSWGTAHYNHVSVDVCLSGHRGEHPVTDADIALIRAALTECRARGYVIAHPIVYPHGTLLDTPPGYPGGSSPTICPDRFTLARWTEVVAACHIGSIPTPHPTPEIKVHPQYSPPLQIVSRFTGPSGAWALQRDGGVITFFGQFHGSMVGNPHFAGRVAALIVKPGTVVAGANAPLPASAYVGAFYEIIAESGERYVPHL